MMLNLDQAREHGGDLKEVEEYISITSELSYLFKKDGC